MDPRIGDALARNDRYILEFVEALNLCPYAKRTREAGRLKREVLLVEGGAPGSPEFVAAATALDDAFRALEALPVEAIDVGLVILPALAPAIAQDAHAFEALLAAARERMNARHANDPPFYCVPFHPGFAGDLADEHRAVRLIRRTPDPTVQLVRASVLRSVRGNGTLDYVKTAGLSAAELMAVSAPLSVSDRIAQANLRALRDQAPGRLDALLSGFRHG